MKNHALTLNGAKMSTDRNLRTKAFLKRKDKLIAVKNYCNTYQNPLL